jgi:acyl-CoA thioesterase FadM
MTPTESNAEKASAESAGEYKSAGEQSVPNFERVLRVQEQDVDRMGLAIAPMYARWMEETEYGFLRSRGLSVSMTDARGRYGFPRTHVEWEIRSAARRGDELRVRLWLGETDGKRLEYRFQLDRKEVVSGASEPAVWERCATGHFVMCCARFPAEAMPYAIPIPESVLEQLGLEEG